MCKLEVTINSKAKIYPIFISNKDISTLHTSIMAQIDNKNYIVIFSKKVYELYGKILNFPKEKIFILKDGETQKNYKNYLKILDFALKNKLTRQDTIVAIGGGVVGDIAGFCASTYMRGINFIQVPTTLLACTDSSVGGKTAINTKYGKNLVGTFYQPKAVFINVNFLKTLNEKEFKSGLGEIVKYGFIEKSCQCDEDLNLVSFLNKNIDNIINRDILTLQELIEICIKLKISVVMKDEKENDLRKILNLGHTFAHAFETLTKYKYSHGECVAQGLIYALDIAFSLNKIDKEYKFLCEDLISKFNFPKIPKFKTEEILEIIKMDKKNSDTDLILILPTSYAQVEAFSFNNEELRNLLKKTLKTK